MKEQAAKDQKEYDEKMQEASGIISEISGWVKEVKVKYERLNRLTYKFATDYYPLSDHNEDMAMKFMAKAYSFTDKEKNTYYRITKNYYPQVMNKFLVSYWLLACESREFFVKLQIHYMSNIEDTIYDLPNEEYHRGERFKDFLSSTQIKDYMVSPKFARYKALHPELFEISIEASEKVHCTMMQWKALLILENLTSGETTFLYLSRL